MRRLILSLLTVLVFLGSCVLCESIFVTKAEAAETSGSLTDTIDWSFDNSTGTLTISGTGEMPRYYEYTEGRPYNSYINRIKKVKIASGITNIGDYAFRDCIILKEISIPDGVVEIGIGAFENCRALERCSLPSNLVKIEDKAFFECESLKEIVFSDSITYIGNSAFYGCHSLTEIEMPSSVTYGHGVFSFCCNLKKVTLCEGNECIEEDCFRDCYSLEEVSIPSTVTKIEKLAFYRCFNLTKISIPSSIETFDQYCFGDNTEPSSLTHIHIGYGENVDSYIRKGFLPQNESYYFVLNADGTCPDENCSFKYSSSYNNSYSSKNYTLWVNGTNVKSENLYYRYSDVPLSGLKGNGGLSGSLPSTCRYAVSVTPTYVNDVNQAFIDGQGGTITSIISAYYSKSRDSLRISANGEYGNVKVWIAEINKKTIVIEAYDYVEVSTKIADKKPTIVAPEETLSDGTVLPERTKNAAVAVGSTIKLAVKSKTIAVSDDTYYNWSVKLPRGADESMVTLKVSDDTRKCSVSVNSLISNDKTDKIEIYCTNEHSRKKAVFQITAENPVASISNISDEIHLNSAAVIKQKITVYPEVETHVANTTDTSDKIAVYVSNDTNDAYTITSNGKFKFDNKNRNKYITAKADYVDRIVLSAKAKTPDGTKGKLIIVATHADGSIDVYESGTIIVGKE